VTANGDSNAERLVDPNRMTSMGRRDAVLRQLLVASPHSYRIDAVWGKFYVSDSTISSDIKILRSVLQQYHLILNRSYDQIWIEGSEADVRRSINDLLITDSGILDEDFGHTDQRMQRRDSAFVTHQLDLIEELTHAKIPYPYNVNLFSHLYILIERYRGAGALIDTSSGDDAQLVSMQQQGLAKVCECVIRNLDDYLDTTLPGVEVANLYQYLTSSRIDSGRITVSEIPEQVRAVTDFLIDRVSEDPSYHDIGSNDLFASLANHIKPLLNRLENHISVKNNLLEQIKLEYPHLFDVVREASAQLVQRYRLNSIDDEENGFITVYFAQALENMHAPINILLVCTTGLGTAQLLKAKIERRFSELNIVETVAVRDLKDSLASHDEVDLVISTVGLPSSVHIATLVVSAMFTGEDQEQLEHEVDRIRKGMSR
jgi:transcriptional antiterminator